MFIEVKIVVLKLEVEEIGYLTERADNRRQVVFYCLFDFNYCIKIEIVELE